MDITYFNLSEIRKKARQDQAAILILTFAQTKLYNPYTTTGLMKSLKINHVPPFLIMNGTLEQNYVVSQIPNPFIEYRDNKIYFTQESSVSRKSYT